MLDELEQNNQAMQALKQAEECIPQIKNKRLIARIYNHLGFLNYKCSNYDLAKLYHAKSLTVNQQIDDTTGIANDLINMGHVYLFHDQYDSAAWCSSQLLQLIPKVDSNLQIDIYHNIAVERIYWKKYAKAEKKGY